jgi:uncharacterized protein YigA (DUF484 family)
MDELMQENEELKKRLKEMTAEAANNETILKRTQARELTLLRADSLAQLLRAMVDGRAARSAARGSAFVDRRRRSA